jgi:hypothetical protein
MTAFCKSSSSPSDTGAKFIAKMMHDRSLLVAPKLEKLEKKKVIHGKQKTANCFQFAVLNFAGRIKSPWP